MKNVKHNSWNQRQKVSSPKNNSPSASTNLSDNITSTSFALPFFFFAPPYAPKLQETMPLKPRTETFNPIIHLSKTLWNPSASFVLVVHAEGAQYQLGFCSGVVWDKLWSETGPLVYGFGRSWKHCWVACSYLARTTFSTHKI